MHLNLNYIIPCQTEMNLHTLIILWSYEFATNACFIVYISIKVIDADNSNWTPNSIMPAGQDWDLGPEGPPEDPKFACRHASN